jgi:radical SAM superfamily enzyme YgiQ (UPF0313 family)
MHFSSDINRPPYEVNSGFLQVTSGCSTHNKCAFCTFYNDSRFKASPLEEIIQDIQELKRRGYPYKRIFLQGADPFVLKYDELMKVSDLIHQNIPSVETIGGYARINNIGDKSIAQLKSLKEVGYSNPYFGVESGDDVVLKKMNKGYTSDFIYEQCSKMDSAGFEYIVNFLNGLGGNNYGSKNAINTAAIYNRIQPTMIYISTLTIMPNSRLKRLIQTGRYIEATEIEKLKELRDFIANLSCHTIVRAEHVSISVPIAGVIPEEKKSIIDTLDLAINSISENKLQEFRRNIVSL